MDVDVIVQDGTDLISAVFTFFVKFECLVQKSIFTFINGNRCDIQCQRIKCKLFTNYNIKVSSLRKTENPSKGGLDKTENYANCDLGHCTNRSDQTDQNDQTDHGDQTVHGNQTD